MQMGPSEAQEKALLNNGFTIEDLEKLREKPRADITTMMIGMFRRTREKAQTKSSIALSEKYRKQRMKIIEELKLKPRVKVCFRKQDRLLQIENITLEGLLKLEGRKDLISPTQIELPVSVESLP